MRTSFYVASAFAFALSVGCSSDRSHTQSTSNPSRDASARAANPRADPNDANDASAAYEDDAGQSALATLIWQRAADCPLARFEAGGLVRDGELWVLGGFTSADLDVTRRVHIYDPTRDRWREGVALPGAETHFGIVEDEGDLLVFGGLAEARASGPTDAVWRLPKNSSDWLLESSLPSRRAAFAWALLGRSLHIAGGLDADNQSDLGAHIVKDLGTGGDWSNAAELPDPRNHGGGAATHGVFLAIAGRHNWDEDKGDTQSVHAFDPASGAWSARAPLPIARSEISAATFTTSDGRVIVIGGSVAGVKPSAAVFEYDPSRDSWRALSSLPEPRKGAVAARIGRRIVVTTGSPTSTDPDATTWVGCCIE